MEDYIRHYFAKIILLIVACIVLLGIVVSNAQTTPFCSVFTIGNGVTSLVLAKGGIHSDSSLQAPFTFAKFSCFDSTGRLMYNRFGDSAWYFHNGLIWKKLVPAAGTGTVTNVSVVTANGVSAAVANPTSTPALTFTLGAITPSSVVATGNVTGANLSGTNTGDQTITLTGPVTGSGTGSFATTITPTAVTAGSYTSANVTVGADGRITAASNGSAGGTVTSVSVTSANGVSGTVATATTTPAITLSLGAITPTSVNSVVLVGASTPSLTVTGTTSVSGANTGDQTITLTGDVTGSGTGSFATTLVTANATPGTYTYATVVVDSKGRVTTASSGSAPTGTVTSVSGTANQIASTGGTTPVLSLVSGGTLPGAWALGTPASMTATNISGTAASLTAGNVTTNANMTGDVTSVGNATTIANNAVTNAKIANATIDVTTKITGRVPVANLPTDAAYLDVQQNWTKSQAGTPIALTDASTIALDLSTGNNFRVTLGGNRTMGVPTNIAAGQTGYINFWQDITGSRTITLPWPYTYSAATAPVLSTGKLAMDKLVYAVDYYATSASITATNATPGVFTWTAHGLVSGQMIQFSAGTTTTPVLNTTYWVTVVDANTFNISTTFANAQAGTLVTTSGTSGSLTATACGISTALNTDFRR